MKKMTGFAHELLQVIDRHILEVNLLSPVDIGGISEDTDRHPWPGDIWESIKMNKIPAQPTLRAFGSLDSSRETFVPLGVVVFQTDLKLNGLDEVAAFFSRCSKEFLDRAPHT